MHSFSDTTGRRWSLDITVQAIRRIRGLTGVDLLDAANGGDVLERLSTDPVLLVDVLYAACKPQADAAGITDEAFGEAMAGDAIEHATAALLDDLVDFSPNQRDRAALAQVIQTARKAMSRARDLRDEAMDQARMDRAMDAELAKLSASLTNAPESSA